MDDAPHVRTRPPVENPVTPEEWINDETGEAARRLWEKNTRASQIECALLVATDAIRPLVEERERLSTERDRYLATLREIAALDKDYPHPSVLPTGTQYGRHDAAKRARAALQDDTEESETK